MNEKEDKTHKYAFWMAIILVTSVTIVSVAKEPEIVTYWEIVTGFLNSVFLQTLAIVATVYFGLKGIDRQHERNKQLKQFEFEFEQKVKLRKIAKEIKEKGEYTLGISRLFEALVGVAKSDPTVTIEQLKNHNKTNIFFRQNWEDEISFLNDISITLAVLTQQQLLIMGQIEDGLSIEQVDDTTLPKIFERYKAFTANGNAVLGEFQRLGIDAFEPETPD